MADIVDDQSLSHDRGLHGEGGIVKASVEGSGYDRFRKRLGREPKGFLAAGGIPEIMGLLQEFRDAGVHKFILRPVATDGEDFIDQTRRFIEHLLPEVSALN